VSSCDDKSYFLLKNALIEMFGVSDSFYEREDQNYYRADGHGLDLDIIYWYNDGYSFEMAYTTLRIHNEREYDQLIRDDDYEDRMSVGDHL
jgi:hypothetical protein